MGGSLGLAIKRRQMANTVAGFARRAETRRNAFDKGVVDEVYEQPEHAVQDADLVVFCTPVGAIVELMKICIPYFSKHSVVTDVGSSKAKIVSSVETLFKGDMVRYVGSHPIAGSEKRGLESAMPELYEHAVVVVTPTPRTDKDAFNRVKTFWTGLNCRVLDVCPEEHDWLIARTSHVPHLVAAMLASNVGRDSVDQARDFCGSGFLDTTRIADGAPELWRNILESNQPAVARELKMFQQQLNRVMKLVETRDFAGLRCFLEESRLMRLKLQGKHV